MDQTRTGGTTGLARAVVDSPAVRAAGSGAIRTAGGGTARAVPGGAIRSVAGSTARGSGGGPVPAAVMGPRLAAEVVAMAAGAGIRLDYSPNSLVLVDRIIGGLRRAHPPRGRSTRAGTAVLVAVPDADADPQPLPPLPPALTPLGGYAGEVLCRYARAEWVDFDSAQRDVFGQDFGVRSVDGRVWNPLGKAVKRYQSGTGESLRLFYLAVAGGARV